ncbi:unnamed protein product [Caenorhabditis bovis]|uniref:C-type lectin domain-containing protein n=1 Tax=Caenorhabditis bovis TaxID=2654633 RepID=A0A8S1EPN7_9PELO|nr:unnamed protein product [Caenorhabditis bovis]
MRRFAILAAILVGALAATCHEEEALDPSGQYCFIVASHERTFHEAEKACYDYGGFHLAIIPSMIDNNFIYNLTRNANVFSNYFWIGATDLTGDGSWEWVDGTRMGFTNWAKGNQAGSCASGPTTIPLRHETVFVKFVGDAESLGDPNTDANVAAQYAKQRDFIAQIADYLFTHPDNDGNSCKYYASPAFYGYAQYEQQFDTSPAWSKGQFDNLLSSNEWDVKTTLENTISDAINGLHKFRWSPPMRDLGYSVLVFLTSRKDFAGIPSLFVPPNRAFDEIIVVSIDGASMPTPSNVPNIAVSKQFTQTDLNAVLAKLKCH